MNPKSITYDTATRKWQYAPVGAQQMIEFPPGPAGKHAAITAKIKIEGKPIYDMLMYLETQTSDKDIIRRAYDGAAMSIDGLIMKPGPNDPKPSYARIANPSKTIEYTIGYGPPRSIYKCSCPDWYHGNDLDTLPPGDPHRPSRGAPYVVNGGVMCKHAWAYHFTRITKAPLQPTNPASDHLCEKTQDALLEVLSSRPDLAILISESNFFHFGRGEVSLAVPPELLDEMDDNQKEELSQATLQITAKSLELVIY